MKKHLKENLPAIIFYGLLIVGVYFIFIKPDDSNSTYKSYNDSSYEASGTDNDYDTGYEWAEDNGIEDFSECDDEFGSGTEAEDGCNEYVQDNTYNEEPEFGGYDCTEDCSGHEAGYEWAEDNDISDEYDCDGNSNSFNEGCMSYVEENY